MTRIPGSTATQLASQIDHDNVPHDVSENGSLRRIGQHLSEGFANVNPAEYDFNILAV